MLDAKGHEPIPPLHPIRDSIPQHILPRLYVEGFVDPEVHIDGAPAVWVHRPALGVFQTAPVEPRGGERHFDVPDERSRWGGSSGRRRGELWGHAGETVLLELNARTLLRARGFVLAPKPAIPG